MKEPEPLVIWKTPHCLLTDSNNMYAIDYICILASDAVTVAHRFKFDSDFIFIKTYNVRNTTAMIRIFQCRSCVISICKADWPHYDRVSSFSPLFTDLRQTRTVYKHTYYKLSKIELLYIRVFPTLYSNHLYRLLLGLYATVKRYNTLFQMKQGIVSRMPYQTFLFPTV